MWYDWIIIGLLVAYILLRLLYTWAVDKFYADE